MTFPLQLFDKNRKPESLHFKGLRGFFYPFLLQKSGYNVLKYMSIVLILSKI
ncbi:hypothetical protein Tsac_2017 [Thermoanaerobacterium saccharolyticum JW/SL-YS485]|uniref:Uncharacterized protein n=1 Tax=Thermoanaerobacterium saccharolyticum (strain DSM 8691 / JW/SL-YS485) TaxID=1094508 RepID=I3VWX6_THESW|nr:hypothetical protein Tsac_2017 [Thermoanaerobacterium saccharolyticum JW/SL-YS485]